ncbi:peptidylprolyl isomerase [Ramlibacter sp. MMS24-I3-19]|uniref:peptidylprolyl isomerase n=1 Tax=Ramlibacter sp. MMS24-I3-19 TaxID=3416606 RepID=UPI003CFF6FC0
MTTLVSRRAVAALALAVAALPSAWAEEAPRVKLSTTLGDIVVEVYSDKAPKTAANFLQYVRDKHYDGTIFHRVIPGFMIQGGGFGPDMQEKITRPPIPLETRPDLKNTRGTLAMARTADPNSATGQFFINVVDNPRLNAPSPDGHGYAVFGKVVSGMDVVDKIRMVPTGNSGMHQNVPTTPVVIKSATLVK